MSKQTLSTSLLAVVMVLMASTATRTFAQTITASTSHHILSAGDPGGTDPDPTGGTGN
jgi:hypothetical protein